MRMLKANHQRTVTVDPDNYLPGCREDVIGVQHHHPDCPFRKSVECPVGIECEHGWDVCPQCDPCTCNLEEPDAK